MEYDSFQNLTQTEYIFIQSSKAWFLKIKSSGTFKEQMTYTESFKNTNLPSI